MASQAYDNMNMEDLSFQKSISSFVVRATSILYTHNQTLPDRWCPHLAKHAHLLKKQFITLKVCGKWHEFNISQVTPYQHTLNIHVTSQTNSGDKIQTE